MPKVTLKGHIVVPDRDLAAIQEELATHIELTKTEEGCLTFEVQQDRSNINRFNVYEVFSDRESFDLHQDRVKKSRWGCVSANIERHYEVSEH